MRVDDLAIVFSLHLHRLGARLDRAGLALETRCSDFGRGEFYALLITVVLGMALLAAAQNLVTVFLALELFSIPLYVLCAADLRRDGSLESGIKYLIIGSLGSATLLYGLALIYGATGIDRLRRDRRGGRRARRSASDALLLVGRRR